MGLSRGLRNAKATALRLSLPVRAAARGIPLPPKKGRLLNDKRTDFIATGDLFLRYFTQECTLRPNESVLDLGCGYGRAAIPLTRYLSREGRYEGIDVGREGVAWCQSRITPAYPWFRFQVADVRNGLYSASSEHSPTEYRLPYADDSFDFAFLISVFTHFLPTEVDHYLSELSRVIRPGGRCLITYFLLNPDVKARMKAGQADVVFAKLADGCWLTESSIAEAAVAYEESSVREMHGRHGLPIREPVLRGKWSGSPSPWWYQDMVIATRK